MVAVKEKVTVEVDANVGPAQRGLSNLSKTAQQTLGKASQGNLSAKGGLFAAIEALPPQAKIAAQALGAVGAAAIYSVHAFTSYADKVRSFQRVAGTSAETSSKFTFALGELGISAEDGARAIFQLEKRVGTGKDGLDKFGITVDRNAKGGFNFEKTLYDISDAYNSTNNQAKKAAIVFSAFGKSGATLIPILQRGRAGLKELFDEAKSTNHILNQDDLDRARLFGLAVKELGATFQGLGIKAGNAITPIVTDLTKMLSSLVQMADAVGVFDAMGTAIQAAFSPLVNMVELSKKFTDTIGLTSSEVSKYSIVQKDLTANQQKYRDLVAEGNGHTKEAKDLLHLIGQEAKYAGTGQDELAGAMQSAEQKAADEARALNDLQNSLLGLSNATRGPQEALIRFQQAQLAAADAQGKLVEAQTKGRQEGESQAAFLQRIQGLQLDVQSSLLGVADAHDAVAAAGLKSVDAQKKFEDIAGNPTARHQLIADLETSIKLNGDATGATQALIDKLQAYDSVNPPPKSVTIIDNASAALDRALAKLSNWNYLAAKANVIAFQHPGGNTPQGASGISIPGATGSPYPMVAHGGEVVLNSSQVKALNHGAVLMGNGGRWNGGSSSGVTIQIQGNILGGPESGRQLVKTIDQHFGSAAWRSN